MDDSNKEGLDLVKEAIEKAGYTGKIKIGMDVAASEFYTRKATCSFLLEKNLVKYFLTAYWCKRSRWARTGFCNILWSLSLDRNIGFF